MVIDDGRAILMLVGLLTGAGFGAWLVHRQWKRHFDARLRESADSIQSQHITLLEKFRAAHTKLHAELEQQRGSNARQVAIAVAEPRAALMRLEQRLKGAYAELDRLRELTSARPARPMCEENHGFAATQPMHAGM
jgi:hypothetical protein